MGLPFRPELHEWKGVQPHIWALITRHLPARKKPWRRRDRKGGRPRSDDRLAFSGILWKLRTGATWSRLPKRFGGRRTIQRRLDRWLRTDFLLVTFRRYLEQAGEGSLERWQDVFDAHRFRRDWWWVFLLEHEYKCFAADSPYLSAQNRVENPMRWALPSSPAGVKA